MTTAITQETETCPQHTGHTALYTSAQPLEISRGSGAFPALPALVGNSAGRLLCLPPGEDNGKGRCIKAGGEGIGFISVYLAKPGCRSWETCGSAQQSAIKFKKKKIKSNKWTPTNGSTTHSRSGCTVNKSDLKNVGQRAQLEQKTERNQANKLCFPRLLSVYKLNHDTAAC